jgi:hypothetical protein
MKGRDQSLDFMASPTGFEPVGLQNGPLIPKDLGHANHRFHLSKGVVLRRFAAKPSVNGEGLTDVET